MISAFPHFKLRTFTAGAFKVEASLKPETKAMTNGIGTRHGGLLPLLRVIGWTLVAGLLIAPAIAMWFTDEVRWTTSDFVFAGVMLIGAGVLAELAVRASADWSYRIGAGLAVLASVLLIWINGAVGIIGSEDEPANLLYLAVIATAFVGAVAARFRARGMTWAMICAAALHAMIGVLAALLGWGQGSERWPQPIIVTSVFFCAIWLGSAALFRRAGAVRESLVDNI
jgi:hypothetical protein